MKKIETGENYLEKITEVYCFVTSDEDGEGVIGGGFEDDKGRLIMMPYVCADKVRMEQLKPRAIEISKHAKIKVKLIKLTQREEIEEYDSSH